MASMRLSSMASSLSFLNVLAFFIQFSLVLAKPFNLPFQWSKWNIDPEVNMNASELIRSKGYPCLEYSVVTDDGFILGVQRIPYGRNESKYTPRPVVFLQHGLLCSSTNWITNLVNESFAFILADTGYDVWLGNVRGNTYSQKHIHYSPKEDAFWDWSWDEMAEYDLPAMINYALKVTQRSQLYYVGHSQGTMIGFAGFSQNKELAEKVKTFFALAPVSTVGDMTSPLRYLSYFLPEIEYLFELFGVKEFLPSDELTKWLATDICSPSSEIFCSSVLFVICGFDVKALNKTRLPVYLAHTPSGTSVQNMVHFAQMVQSDLFQMYDYGSAEKNKEHYNVTVPPLYYPENMTTPTVVYSGGMDWLADPKDVEKLLPRIPKLLKHTMIPEYDHLDFVWGINAADKVYHPIIDMIRVTEAEERKADIKLRFDNRL
ncbi:Gastric triacylglycerol lipase [Holothuria leucospilota]|uniref:Lipase n=1 Tax=Holothuria leucospilota TaxID=206669 RepID=A0A9Q1H3U8_HOLLE|nr:Gastric triacylglycerol lipase [Holothuria leucospilota]